MLVLLVLAFLSVFLNFLLARTNIFQYHLNDKVPKVVLPSPISLLEPSVAGVKHLQTENRTRDTPVVAAT
ncbi:hypothetical protein GUJ93_ZPchr0005g14279 [Zizania palustris]|uniref:Secreted protein n=1 Tax=Zizania palustris TaxID=103762 RepID=A0A8J5VIP9_ZIZPA|nr:hypothetical protein GUJ93_ZPchr0005g14279 [Zizania palustris]